MDSGMVTNRGTIQVRSHGIMLLRLSILTTARFLSPRLERKRRRQSGRSHIARFFGGRRAGCGCVVVVQQCAAAACGVGKLRGAVFLGPARTLSNPGTANAHARYRPRPLG